jgi:rRNA-processing protein EBP2
MAKSKPVATSKAEKPTFPRPVVSGDNLGGSSSSSDDDDDDDDDDGVDEAGMNRLMELLGDDGLDEFGAAQLKALADSGIDDDENEAGEDEASEDGDESSASQSGASNQDEEEEEDHDEDKEISDSEHESRDNDEEHAEQNEDEEEEEVMALDDASSVDEDAVPRQKIVINNTVCPNIFSNPVTVSQHVLPLGCTASHP